MADKNSIAFIGGGQMATALLTGALSSGVLKPEQVVVVEPSPHQRESLNMAFPAVTIVATADQVGDCKTILLAVKPQVLREVGGSLAKQLPGDRLWISIVAGVSLPDLATMLGTKRVVRVMPNTPAQIGAGAAGLASGVDATLADVAWVISLMQSVGICLQVAEAQLHAVTGVASSSPAYIYLVIEAMADAGVAGGLPRDVSLKLAAQSVLGAAKMVLETGKHPGELKDQVTSPGGTTIEAIRQLEKHGMRSALIEAVSACIAKSKQLEQG